MKTFWYTVDWNSQWVHGSMRADTLKEALARIATWYNYEAVVLRIREVG